MTPFDSFQIYTAIKLHFTSDKYNYFFANGKSKNSLEAFQNRKDQAFFHLAVKHFNEKTWPDFLVSNFLDDEEKWIGDLFTDESKARHTSRLKTIQALSYTFRQDLLALKEFIDELPFAASLQAKGGRHPLLVRMAMHEDIHLETFVILHKILDVCSVIEKTLDDTLVWPAFKRKAIKYSFFVDIQPVTYSKILQEIFPKI